MFQVGDKVMYSVVGACEVTEIAPPPIKGVDNDYYYLQPAFDNKGIIYSPADNMKVAMRLLSTPEECKKLIERAKNCKKDPLLNERVTAAQYDEFIKSQDTLLLMQLIRSLYNVKNERAKDLRKMKSADSRMLIAARKLLYGELAVVLGKDLSEMNDEMDAYLSVN